LASVTFGPQPPGVAAEQGREEKIVADDDPQLSLGAAQGVLGPKSHSIGASFGQGARNLAGRFVNPQAFWQVGDRELHRTPAGCSNRVEHGMPGPHAEDLGAVDAGLGGRRRRENLRFISGLHHNDVCMETQCEDQHGQ